MVKLEDKEKRLDLLLFGFSEDNQLGLSRTFLQQLIRKGQITVDSKVLKAHYKVRAGQIIDLKIPSVLENRPVAEDIPLDIVYEDEDIIVVNKAAGMVVHSGAGNPNRTLVNALLFRYSSLSNINPARPGIVHRLDKGTSGLLAVARNNPSHLNLARQFASHSIMRKYVALVEGRIDFNEDVIELPIGRDRRRRDKMSVTYLSKSRAALTKFRVLKRTLDYSLLELSPFTGRTHQLRVHLSFLGHPILGDEKYGRKESFPRLALHAYKLGLVHPRTNKFMEFSTPIPGKFLEAVE